MVDGRDFVREEKIELKMDTVTSLCWLITAKVHGIKKWEESL